MEQRDYKQAVDRIVVNKELRSKVFNHIYHSKNKKNNIREFAMKHTKIAVAAIILLLVITPVTAIAARGIWQQHMNVSVHNIGKYAMNYTFETVSGENKDSDVTSLIHVPVKLEYGYIPDGYIAKDIKIMNSDSTGGFSIVVYSVDENNPLNFQGVTKITDTEVSGHKAVIQERSLAWNSLLIFYDEYGYAVQIYYKGVSMDELMNFGNGLKLVQCDNSESVFITDAKYSSPQSMTTKTKAPATTNGSGFTAIGNAVKGYKNSIWMSTDLSFTVEKVELLDSISGFDNKDGFSYNDGINKYFAVDGSVLPKSVEQIVRGDGINSVDTIGDTITYNQKLVYLTIKCVNNSDKLLENMIIKPRLIVLKQNGGEYSEGSTLCDAYCDKPYTPDLNRYNNNYFTIQPNEQFEYHVAYLLTEEELSKTLLADFSIGGAKLSTGDKWFVRIAN